MTATRPLVSVCIAVYNCETYIRQTIESVLRQSLRDVEIVVADNASTDRTVEVVASLADPRIRLIQNDCNVGFSRNFQIATSAARGRYLKLLCADDVLYPTCLERQVSALDSDPSLSIVCCRRDVIDAAGHVMFRNHGWRGPTARYAGTDAIRRMVRTGRNMIGEPLTVLFPARLARRVAEADLLNFDIDLWCRLLACGDLLVIPESLGAFRISGTSGTAVNWGIPPNQRKYFQMLRDNGVAPITRLDILLGTLRAQRDCLLRSLVILYIRLFGTMAPPRSNGR